MQIIYASIYIQVSDTLSISNIGKGAQSITTEMPDTNNWENNLLGVSFDEIGLTPQQSLPLTICPNNTCAPMASQVMLIQPMVSKRHLFV